MQGWAGKILDINLTDSSIETRPLDMEMARLFLGGRGLGARFLWDLVGPEVEPLSPETDTQKSLDRLSRHETSGSPWKRVALLAGPLDELDDVLAEDELASADFSGFEPISLGLA